MLNFILFVWFLFLGKLSGIIFLISKFMKNIICYGDKLYGFLLYLNLIKEWMWFYCVGDLIYIKLFDFL